MGKEISEILGCDRFLFGGVQNFVTSGRFAPLNQWSIINFTLNLDRNYKYGQEGASQENLSPSISQQLLESCQLSESIMVLAKSKNAVGLGNRFVSPI